MMRFLDFMEGSFIYLMNKRGKIHAYRDVQLSFCCYLYDRLDVNRTIVHHSKVDGGQAGFLWLDRMRQSVIVLVAFTKPYWRESLGVYLCRYDRARSAR